MTTPALPQLKIAILVPAYGSVVNAALLDVMVHLGFALSTNELRFLPVAMGYIDVNPVDKARNEMLARAEQAGADWLLMMDADTWVQGSVDGFDPGAALLRMVSDAAKANAAVVAAPVIRRATGSITTQQELMIYRLAPSSLIVSQALKDRGFDRLQATKDRIRSVKLEHGARNEQIEIDFAATAVMALNLKHPAVQRNHFEFTDQLSEDLEFCRKVREAGGTILCDARVNTAHLSKSYPLVF